MESNKSPGKSGSHHSKKANSGQPEPMKGSHKVKQKNHVSQTNGEG